MVLDPSPPPLILGVGLRYRMLILLSLDFSFLDFFFDISWFLILSIEIFSVFGLFLITFFQSDFLIPAGWPNFSRPVWGVGLRYRMLIWACASNVVIVSSHRHSSHSLPLSLVTLSARPYESCKIFKGRPRRNAFSKLVHRQYKSFPPHRFCQVEIKNTTGLSNKPSNA